MVKITRSGWICTAKRSKRPGRIHSSWNAQRGCLQAEGSQRLNLKNLKFEALSRRKVGGAWLNRKHFAANNSWAGRKIQKALVDGPPGDVDRSGYGRQQTILNGVERSADTSGSRRQLG